MHLDTNTNTILTQSNLHTCILSRHMYFVYARVFGLFVPWYTGIFWSRAERSSLKIIFFIFHFGSESAPLYSTSHVYKEFKEWGQSQSLESTHLAGWDTGRFRWRPCTRCGPPWSGCPSPRSSPDNIVMVRDCITVH